MTKEELQQEPCEDAINRKAAIEYLCTNMNWYDEDGYTAEYDEKVRAITDLINGVPPITPVRPKGNWISIDDELIHEDWQCDVCGRVVWDISSPYDFCPHCGADMREESNADS